jgi:hypothetical protein
VPLRKTATRANLSVQRALRQRDRGSELACPNGHRSGTILIERARQDAPVRHRQRTLDPVGWSWPKSFRFSAGFQTCFPR